MTWFVNMQDTFLSGWGEARNGRALYCIKCSSYTQALNIAARARARSEMKHVAVSSRPRKMRPGDQRTIRDASELGEVWTG